MTSRRKFLYTGGLGLLGVSMAQSAVGSRLLDFQLEAYPSKRPLLAQRKFTSPAVESLIQQVKGQIKNPKLAWLFENCYPNTLDTTVHFGRRNNQPDTFVITGDIDAMWLRDSSAQVYPYVALCAKDHKLSAMIEGVIRRQTHCIQIDPYANAFNREATGSYWEKDNTRMLPELHERKWEIDSLCYPIRLAHHYWKSTGQTQAFTGEWRNAMRAVVQTFRQQQRKNGTKDTPYTFTRQTDRAADTLMNFGYGNPIQPVGLICSAFRPSDDATVLSFLIPSNLFAVESLRQLAEMSTQINNDSAFATECLALADEVMAAVQRYGIVEHPKYGAVYAYEVDGFGGRLLMDDSNVPNLLALPYLCSFIKTTDPIYQNTRRLVLSEDNPYYFKGTAAAGLGGPHVGIDWIWPLSLITQAMTTSDPEEIKSCIETLVRTDADTGFMHEAFHKNDPKQFTRAWFAWANTLFGELIVQTAGKYPEILKF